ncbi:MAG TPA: hypothetical protein PKA00_09245 [Saprospiraceae bacterium]|nr:hypothetical protein [Saprospiraceae bacterium]HMQ83082.1 hypothetical protein [Saprospiraceae bacterium]
MTNTYEDDQPIASLVSEPEVPYSQEYVSLLAHQGKIDAFKEGRNWFASKEAAMAYMWELEKTG